MTTSTLHMVLNDMLLICVHPDRIRVVIVVLLLLVVVLFDVVVVVFRLLMVTATRQVRCWQLCWIGLR